MDASHNQCVGYGNKKRATELKRSMALGYTGSWLYIQRDLSFACLAVNIDLAVSDSRDHLAARAFNRCPVNIQFIFQRLLLCSYYFTLRHRFAQHVTNDFLQLAFVFLKRIL